MNKLIKISTIACLLSMVMLTANSCKKDDEPKYAEAKEATADGAIINGVKWAGCNVDAPGTFAAKPEDAGMLYQWNSKIGWSATDPLIATDGSTVWKETTASADLWEPENDPSPEGWRIPTKDELGTLFDKDKVRMEWATVNGVNGIKIIDNTTANSIFLPATNARNNPDGVLDGQGLDGLYWSNAFDYDAYYGTGASCLYISNFMVYVGFSKRTCAMSVRCVAK